MRSSSNLLKLSDQLREAMLKSVKNPLQTVNVIDKKVLREKLKEGNITPQRIEDIIR